jgi:hypothetical protein
MSDRRDSGGPNIATQRSSSTPATVLALSSATATATTYREKRSPITINFLFACLLVGYISMKSIPMLGLGMFVDRRLPPSSRHHESGVWQGLYRLEVEVVSDSTRCNGKIGRCNGRKTRSCKRDYSDVSSNDSSSVIWKITREYLNL